MEFNELINSGWARHDSQADVVLHELEEHAALADTRSRAVPYWMLFVLLTAFPSALLAEPYRVAKQADLDAMPADVKHVVCDPTVTDKVLKGLLAAKELQELDLYHCRNITSGGLQPLWRLKKLRRLNLDMCRQLEDSTLMVLGAFESLEELNLHQGVQYTNKGMEYLAKLKNLRSINLGMFWKADGEGLEHVLSLPKLHTLELRLNAWVTDEVLARIAEAKPALKKLNLRECGAYSAKGLGHLASLSQLEWLDVGGHKQLGVGAMTEIAKMKQLRHLDLIVSGILRDEELAPLKELSRLQFLGLETVPLVTGICFEGWDMPELEQLELKNNSLTAAGLRAVSRLTSLKRLYLRDWPGDQLGEEALQPLGSLKSLEFFSVTLQSLSDETLGVVASLPKLAELQLFACEKVTDAGFARLKQARSLRRVRVLNCDGISDAAMDELRKALPKCEVIREKEPY